MKKGLNATALQDTEIIIAKLKFIKRTKRKSHLRLIFMHRFLLEFIEVLIICCDLNGTAP